MMAIIKKMLNSSPAATRLAEKTVWIPDTNEPVKNSPTINVITIAGTTTFLRASIVNIITRIPTK